MTATRGHDNATVSDLTRVIDYHGSTPPIRDLTRTLYGGWSYAYEANVYLLAREACQLSQRAVATHLGISPATYRAWEQGTRAPRYEHALRNALRNYLQQQLDEQHARRQRGQLDAYQVAKSNVGARRGRPIAS